MRTEKRTVYITDDGQAFDNMIAAARHERYLSVLLIGRAIYYPGIDAEGIAQGIIDNLERIQSI